MASSLASSLLLSVFLSSVPLVPSFGLSLNPFLRLFFLVFPFFPFFHFLCVSLFLSIYDLPHRIPCYRVLLTFVSHPFHFLATMGQRLEGAMSTLWAGRHKRHASRRTACHTQRRRARHYTQTRTSRHPQGCTACHTQSALHRTFQMLFLALLFVLWLFGHLFASRLVYNLHTCCGSRRSAFCSSTLRSAAFRHMRHCPLRNIICNPLLCSPLPCRCCNRHNRGERGLAG
mmetsp:Transcript_103090/g.166156  ORF Transcript_103090/g.166156 Transcript_103090/m.166156 type:complete len:230 (-) Transcript_103090:1548-2237(-)